MKHRVDIAFVPLFGLAICVSLWLAAPVSVFAQADRRLPAPGQSGAGRRLALVVGNDAYKLAPLRNARNDARAIASALETLGFEVTRVEDASRQTLTRSLTQFGDRLQQGDLAVFYYAGHGVQLDGENYLVPVDFEAESTTGVRLNGIRASEVQNVLERAQVALLIFDACRTNPFAGTRGSGGLAAMEPRGSLIAFATGAGQTASDNLGFGNGIFTSALLQVLTEPGLSLRQIFYEVRQRVYTVTAGQQFPAVYDGLLGDLVLKPSSTASAVVTAAENRLRAEPGDVSPRPEAASPPVDPSLGTRWVSSRDSVEAVWVPPGTFQFGSPSSEAGRQGDERQSTQVVARGFWLDASEVTYRAYARFLADRPEWRRDRIASGLHDGNYLSDWPSGNLPAGKQFYPVVNVSWSAAQAYCEWAGKRLPTEIEWEYAARAGTATTYWWGDNFDASRANNGDGALEVGAPSRANPWGLADMLGNVWEWTMDAAEQPTGPGGPVSRVTRGGSWSSHPQFLRAANRNQTAPETTSELLGFRCAR